MTAAQHQIAARRMSPRIAVSVVYVVAMFMAIMDTTIVNVALPTISRDLSVPLNRVDGVVVGFLVALAVFIPASGWLGDRFGTRRVFLAALVLRLDADAVKLPVPTVLVFVLVPLLSAQPRGK